MPLTHLIFDLDNTLYPPSRGVVERVDARINQFMIDRLGLTPEQLLGEPDPFLAAGIDELRAR